MTSRFYKKHMVNSIEKDERLSNMKLKNTQNEQGFVRKFRSAYESERSMWDNYNVSYWHLVTI